MSLCVFLSVSSMTANDLSSIRTFDQLRNRRTAISEEIASYEKELSDGYRKITSFLDWKNLLLPLVRRLRSMLSK